MFFVFLCVLSRLFFSVVFLSGRKDPSYMGTETP